MVKGVNGALLDGFTITGGNANHPNAWDQQQGGGIYCDWGNTTNFWNSDGNAFWQPQTAITHDGISAAASGIIGDGQSSALWTSVNGPGQISCWWRVSSEVGGDPLKFFLNSQEMARISGETFWQTLSFNVPEGLHTVRWLQT